jgi:hypothetical protein
VHSFGLLIGGIFSPLFSEQGPVSPESIPAGVLVTACAAFLGVLAWAVRRCIVGGSAGIHRLYTEIVLPAGRSHVALMEALRSTREQDSQSLKSLANSQEVILDEIKALNANSERQFDAQSKRGH